MDPTHTTDPSACTSPDGAPPSLTPAAGVQTERPVVTATVTDAGCHPREVTVTIDGAAHVVDVSRDRDDWQMPDVDDAALEIRVMVAVDDAVSEWDDGAEVSPMARQRARMDRAIWGRS
jgi:DNA-binding protein YbaB